MRMGLGTTPRATKPMTARQSLERPHETGSVVSIPTATVHLTRIRRGRWRTVRIQPRTIRHNGSILTETATATIHRVPTVMRARSCPEHRPPIASVARTPMETDFQTPIRVGRPTTAPMHTPTTPTAGATTTAMDSTMVWTTIARCTLAPRFTTERAALTKTVMATRIRTPHGRRQTALTRS